MKSNIKIIVVDDSIQFMQGITFYLSQIDRYTIINTANNGEDFLKLNNVAIADIILMDIEMPELDGISATKKILETYPFLKIVAITNYEERAYFLELIYAGFKGCLLKKNTLSQIDNAINTTINNKLFFPDIQ